MRHQEAGEHPKQVMRATLAGSWYSADGARLRAELESYLQQAGTACYSGVRALMAPHAGYAYSGPAAAFAYREVVGQPFKRVVVIGLTHRIHLPNRISVADATHYLTPLGEIPMDTEWIKKLRALPIFDFAPRAHEGENSIELQIPFLQVALGDFKLVMLAVGQLDQSTVRQAADALLALMDDDTLVVASGDFTHYGERFDYVPFRSDLPANLKLLDMGAFEAIQAKDVPGWYEYLDKTGATICGRCSFALLMAMLSDKQEVHLSRYTTSGEVTGDWQNSVSYVAAVVTGPWEKKDEENMNKDESESAGSRPALFSDAEKKGLLRLARGTIERAMSKSGKPSPEDLDVEVTPAMRQVMGVFVTLNKRHQLRGCIGEILPRRELYKAVIERALSAAFEDPRFPPVTASELPDIEIEISALTPPVPVDGYQDIVIGRHGMILQKGFHSAVFLPQVAPEQGWDLATTLTHLSMKAGLGPQAWREGCSYEVFEATVFNEGEFDDL